MVLETVCVIQGLFIAWALFVYMPRKERQVTEFIKTQTTFLEHLQLSWQAFVSNLHERQARQVESIVSHTQRRMKAMVEYLRDTLVKERDGDTFVAPKPFQADETTKE